MGLATTQPTRPIPASVPEGSSWNLAPRAEWPEALPQILASHKSSADTLHAFAEALSGAVPLAALLCFDSESDGRVSNQPQCLAGSPDWVDERAMATLVDWCGRTCDERMPRVVTPADGLLVTTVIVPVPRKDGRPSALCAMLTPETIESPQRFVEILQFVAAHLSLWRERQNILQLEHEARNLAALLEVVRKIELAESTADGSALLANELQAFLGCQRVVVGLCGSSGRQCQVQAVSGVARFDRHAEFTKAVEAALDESLLIGEIVAWPPMAGQSQQAAKAHEQLLVTAQAKSVLSSPLYAEDDEPIGAWLLLNPGEGMTEVFARAAQRPLGSALQGLQRGSAGSIARWRRKLLRRAAQQKLYCGAAALACLAILLAWPWTHRIKCECQLQPVTRRFLAAPFDGRLEKSYVNPGDVVNAGDILAVMDGREIGLEISALEADYGRARKSWEASLSLDEIYEAQQAKLEMQRIESKIQVLRERQQSLQIKSPFTGIVVSGELKRSEGSPLTVGQNLLEIAPLERMRVEIQIPESEIAYVKSDMEIDVRLDAFPRTPHRAKLLQIVPRAEVKDERFVFVGHSELDNSSGMLRPGMNGRTTLLGPPRRLAWLLFHKPYESLLMLLGW